jgi:hypothetical protein
MRFFTLLTLFGTLLWGESFITPAEYAKRLYHNPRGIGCHHCHGEQGKGLVVARYRHKNEDRTFEGPAIDAVDFKTFSDALNERVRGMPRYFLTQNEVKALYYYLHPEMVPGKEQQPTNAQTASKEP